MAKAKEINTNQDIVQEEVSKDTVQDIEQITVKTEEDALGGVSPQELLLLIKNLQNEVKNLKENNTIPNTVLESTADLKTDAILKLLTNNKSNKEVIVVHNMEMLGELSTVVNLSNLSIKFRKLGEQRVLTWQQFEELLSKYRGYFDRDILLLDSQHQDLMERYNIKCYNSAGKGFLNQTILNSLGDMTIAELEQCYTELGETGKDSLLSFWLGKCYGKDLKFFDRYKLELLNRLSKSRTFDSMINEMNSDFYRGKTV